MPPRYKEKNNKLYFEEQDWVNKVVEKLVKLKVVKEVSQAKFVCINPLTMLKNDSGKRRLCLDLLRCYSKKPKLQSSRSCLGGNCCR